MSEPVKITWTQPMLDRFKAALTEHADMPGETFTFEGHEFDKGFAKYLIKYLEDRL